MSIAPSLEWVFQLAAALLGATGLLVLVAALFRDRPRGRRRCPRCWYDMAGTAGLRCPECGGEQRAEKRLFRTRRRWGRAALALILMLVAGGVGATPAVLAGHWERIVPSTALVLGVGAFQTPSNWAYGYSSGGVTRTLQATSLRELLSAEFERRFYEGSLWRWQSALALRRAAADIASTSDAGVRQFDESLIKMAAWARKGPAPLRGTSVALIRAPRLNQDDIAFARRTLIRLMVSVTPRCSADSPLWLRVDPASRSTQSHVEVRSMPARSSDDPPWRGDDTTSWAWSDRLIGPFEAEAGSLQTEVRMLSPGPSDQRDVEEWRVAVPFPVPAPVPTPAPVVNEDLARALREDVIAGFSFARFYDGRPLLWIDTDSRLHEPMGGATSFRDLLARTPALAALRLEVLRDGRIVARGSTCLQTPSAATPPSYPGGQLIEVQTVPDAPPSLLAEPAVWVLRVRGDPDVCVRNGGNSYWSGSVEMPLRAGPDATPWVDVDEWRKRRGGG